MVGFQIPTVFDFLGKSGHGSQFIEDTAASKVQFIMSKFSDYKGQQEHLLQSNPKLRLGDVTTVNLVKIDGGSQVQPQIFYRRRYIDRVPYFHILLKTFLVL